MNPDNAACLTAAGIDRRVLANNHVLDGGRAGLLETLETAPASTSSTATRPTTPRGERGPARENTRTNGHV